MGFGAVGNVLSYVKRFRTHKKRPAELRVNEVRRASNTALGRGHLDLSSCSLDPQSIARHTGNRPTAGRNAPRGLRSPPRICPEWKPLAGARVSSEADDAGPRPRSKRGHSTRLSGRRRGANYCGEGRIAMRTVHSPALSLTTSSLIPRKSSPSAESIRTRGCEPI